MEPKQQQHKIQMLDGTIQQQAEELQSLQETRGQKAPENASDDLVTITFVYLFDFMKNKIFFCN